MPADPASSSARAAADDPRERSYAGIIPPIGDAADSLPVDAAAGPSTVTVVAGPSAVIPAAMPADPAGPVAAPPVGSAGDQGRVSRTIVNAGILILFVLIAGFTHPAAKDAVEGGVPPLTLGALRFGVAALLLISTYQVMRGWKRRRAVSAAPAAPIDPADYLRLLAAAALCVPINQACFLKGIALSSASHGGLFYALNPVLTYVITLLLGRAVWSRRLGLATVLALSGALVVSADSFHDRWTLIGDGLLFGAVLTWALFTIVVAPLSTRYGALRTIMIVMTIGSLLHLPLVAFDFDQLHWERIGARALFGVAFITVLTSYLNYLLWTIALTRIDLNRIVVTVNAGPIVAVIASHYWRGDPITRWLTVGAALIITAITLANWDKIRALLSQRRRATATA